LDVNNKFTHDTFGVGGINRMAIIVIIVATIGGMGQTQSQCDLDSITSFNLGVD
jgi:hypothetical protein